MIQERQYYIDIFQTGVEEMKRLAAIALANGGDTATSTSRTLSFRYISSLTERLLPAD